MEKESKPNTKGHIDWSQFLAEAKELEVKSEGEWKIEFQEDQVPGGAYLSNASLKQINQVLLRFEYHVIYSLAYSVPVLYWNVSTLNGQLVPLDQIWPTLCNARNLDPTRNVMSQGEHPLLHRPF